jgi:methylated-DNA-[protein]-cysteine S-methyltransferase
MERAGTVQLWSERLATPIGVLVLLRDDDGRLRALEWEDLPARMERALRLHHGAAGFTVRTDGVAGASEAARRLRRYFDGELSAIDDIPVATGGTPFQRRVWQVLRTIPAGTTITYAEMARRIGRPTAFRAAGHANGANPISIVVPCHRVVGSDASLTGYGGGTERKRWLLAHEGVAGLRR